jgi:hypothetical protein
MLCYVMSCYVMLCYVMLCYVMLYYVMLYYVMLCYVTLCYVMLCCVMLCYVIYHFVIEANFKRRYEFSFLLSEIRVSELLFLHVDDPHLVSFAEHVGQMCTSDEVPQLYAV